GTTGTAIYTLSLHDALPISEQLESNEPLGAEGADHDLAALLEAAQAQVAQYHDELLRAKAEVENIRRRAQDDVAKARKFGTESRSEEHTSELQSRENLVCRL